MARSGTSGEVNVNYLRLVVAVSVSLFVDCGVEAVSGIQRRSVAFITALTRVGVRSATTTASRVGAS